MSDEKKQSGLEEFPDGGRATLVRRYSPALTKQQLDLLVFCPYDSPGHIEDEGQLRKARVLKRAGLLEEDPQTPRNFRVTSAGADVVLLWKYAGWLT